MSRTKEEIESMAFKAQLGQVLKNCSNERDAWPFLSPVDTEAEPNYLKTISKPMDLKTMGQKLDNGEYDIILYLVVVVM
jgi:hypothetical protein